MYPMYNTQPALPPNWERKWDPHNGKFFYINHATKTTQWEPPTQSYPRPQQQQENWGNFTTQQNNSKVNALVNEFAGLDRTFAEKLLKQHNNRVHVVKSLLTGYGYKRKGTEAQEVVTKAQTTSFTEADRNKVQALVDEYQGLDRDLAETMLKENNNKMDVVKNLLKEMGYKVKKIEADRYKVEELTNMYPSLSKELAESLLVRLNNNVTEAKEVLSSMGYNESGESSESEIPDTESESSFEIDPKTVAEISAKYENASKDLVETLLKLHGNDAKVCEKTLVERGYRLKPTADQALANRLVKEFTSLSEGIAKDVLVGQKNNYSKSYQTLVDMNYKPIKQKTAVKKGPTAAHKNKAMKDLMKKYPEVNEQLIRMCLEGTDYDIKTTISVIDASIESTKPSASQTKPTKTTMKSNKKDDSVQSTSRWGTSKTSIKPVSATVMTPKKLDKRPVKTQKTSSKATNFIAPPQRGFTRNSKNAKGPDHRNVKGPNPMLLSENFVEVMGSNKGLVNGPQSFNRQGPNKYNRCSREYNLANGTAGLANGPANINRGPMSIIL